MTKSNKAAMLSALIFPGAGHFFLKKHLAGIVLSVAAFVPLYFIISDIVQRALQIADKIQRGEIQIDVEVITELLSNQSTVINTELFNFAWTVLIIAWLIGIADSYRVGRAQAKAEAAVTR